jgi:hypothetical protein
VDGTTKFYNIVMKKVYRIVQYIQPWEIDDFERQVDQLIKSSYYLDSDCTVILDCTMNLNIIDWELSNIPKDYFLNKFKCLESRVSNRFVSEFDTDSKICGVTDKRRSVQTKSQDYIIWLDSDLYFSVYTLVYLIQASRQLTISNYILSPQIIKYWDSSWDIIVADKYLSMPFNHRDFFDTYSLDYEATDNVVVKSNQSIKFGGGWFNLFTDSLIKSIPIDERIGAYGPDDTYLTYCCMINKYPQFILENVVVSEIGNMYLKDKNYIKPLLAVKISDKEKITDQELNSLIHEYFLKNQKV